MYISGTQQRPLTINSLCLLIIQKHSRPPSVSDYTQQTLKSTKQQRPWDYREQKRQWFECVRETWTCDNKKINMHADAQLSVTLLTIFLSIDTITSHMEMFHDHDLQWHRQTYTDTDTDRQTDRQTHTNKQTH